jgi:hypothetical protein
MKASMTPLAENNRTDYPAGGETPAAAKSRVASSIANPIFKSFSATSALVAGCMHTAAAFGDLNVLPELHYEGRLMATFFCEHYA